jgi:exonuclease I
MVMQPVLYVILLGLVMVVYARFIPKEQTTVSSANATVVQEIEDTIEHFAAEMDEQNQAMLDLFSKTKQDYEVELAKLAGRLETLERQKHELSKELTTLHVNQPPVLSPAEMLSALNAPNHGIPASVNVIENAPDPLPEEPVYVGLSMKSRYSELFTLHNQGKSVEAIAKKLSMNKGEVSLILQLSRQEERTRV